MGLRGKQPRSLEELHALFEASAGSPTGQIEIRRQARRRADQLGVEYPSWALRERGPSPAQRPGMGASERPAPSPAAPFCTHIPEALRAIARSMHAVIQVSPRGVTLHGFQRKPVTFPSVDAAVASLSGAP